MLGAILTITALAAIGAFGYLLCWKAAKLTIEQSKSK